MKKVNWQQAKRKMAERVKGGVSLWDRITNITAQGCGWKTPKFGLSSRLNSILDTDMQAFH